jgi:pSer/pThr/pTyr-binding forkhead associated (FHA) protein
MQKCPSCGHINRPGVIFCENCGVSLLEGARPVSTKSLADEKQSEIESLLGRKVFDAGIQGTDKFPEGGTLRMEIEGSPEPILLHFENPEVILGRRDPATGALPDVDLTPFAGYRMGVSRRHSMVRYANEGLEILDLGSANGTVVNGQRLEPHHPLRLHDGDKMVLGQIVIQVHFQKPAAVAEPAVPREVKEEKPPIMEPAKAEVEQIKPPAEVKPAPAPSEVKPAPAAETVPAASEAKPAPAAEAKPTPAASEAKPAPATEAKPAPAAGEVKPAPATEAKPVPAASEAKPVPTANEAKPSPPAETTAPPPGKEESAAKAATPSTGAQPETGKSADEPPGAVDPALDTRKFNDKPFASSQKPPDES